MRSLALCIVVASLVLGLGGVASRPLAEPEVPGSGVSADTHPVEARPGEPAPGETATSPAPEPMQRQLDEAVSDLAQGKAVAKSCSVPLLPGKPIQIDFSHVVPPKGFVSLNRTGYNYRTPGDPPQIIPDSTGNRRPPALARP